MRPLTIAKHQPAFDVCCCQHRSSPQVHTWREEILRGGQPQAQPDSTPSIPLDGSEEEAGVSLAPASASQRPHQRRADTALVVQGANSAASMSAANATNTPARWRVHGSSLGRLGRQLLGCFNFRMKRKQVGARMDCCGMSA